MQSRPAPDSRAADKGLNLQWAIERTAISSGVENDVLPDRSVRCSTAWSVKGIDGTKNVGGGEKGGQFGG